MTDLASSPPDGAATLGALPLQRLREHRARLLEESARAARWRRLVQARLDLAVDAAAPVDDLAGPTGLEAAWARVVRDAPPPGGDPVELLRQVDRVRAELNRYAAQLRGDLAEATDELVDRYAFEPSCCLAAVPTR